MIKVQFGIDKLLAQAPSWKTQRIGLVTNNAALTSAFVPSRKALLAQQYNLVKLFSPEHGLDTTGPDGHFMRNGNDTLTGLPVVSLYGHKLMPDKEDLEDIDVLLLDLPDVGSRFYTYLWTLTYVLEASALFNKPLIVLDRPNPLSGNLLLAEGPLLDEETASSFIGRWQMPVRHSCTLGELALYFNAVKQIGCPLQVIPCEGWYRDLLHPDWSTSFVPASPAINCFEATLLYPGLCLLEATNISEGRGTAVPFRVAGTPWLRSGEITTLFNKNIDDDVVAREVDFVPEAGRYTGQSCKGLMLHVTGPCNFRPVRAGLLLLKLIRDTHAGAFEWAPYKTHVNGTGENHLKLLTGKQDAGQMFELLLPDFMRGLNAFTNTGEWAAMVGPYLLYGSKI